MNNITMHDAFIILIITLIALGLSILYYIISEYWCVVRDASYEGWKKLHIKYLRSKPPILLRGIMRILFFIGNLGM